MIPILKYGSGFPFCRLQRLQENLGLPFPASTQWDIVKTTANRIQPVYNELIRQAAQGEIIYNVDTTMKILALIKTDQDNPDRKGVFTTGIISIAGDVKIALFMTGKKPVGENMDELLKKDNRVKLRLSKCVMNFPEISPKHSESYWPIASPMAAGNLLTLLTPFRKSPGM